MSANSSMQQAEAGGLLVPKNSRPASIVRPYFKKTNPKKILSKRCFTVQDLKSSLWIFQGEKCTGEQFKLLSPEVGMFIKTHSWHPDLYV